MAEGFISNQDKIEFKQIVLQHLKKILDISTHEFTGGYNKTIPHPHMHITEYVPDMRKCYIQAVESLADVLLPHSDKEMIKQLEGYEEEVDNIKGDYKKSIYKERKREWEFKRKKMIARGKQNNIDFPQEIDLEELLRRPIEIKAGDRKGFSKQHLKLARRLFQQLNLLLKRVDYLNKAVYTEEEEPEINEVDNP